MLLYVSIIHRTYSSIFVRLDGVSGARRLFGGENTANSGLGLFFNVIIHIRLERWITKFSLQFSAQVRAESAVLSIGLVPRAQRQKGSQRPD